MELKKLWNIFLLSPITDKPGKWNINFGYSTVDYLCRYFGCRRLGRIEDFGETHLDFLKQYGDFDKVFLFTIPLPELYPVSVLQNSRVLY